MDFYTRHANGREPTSVAEKLYRWSIPEPNSGCWLWESHVNNQGYGFIRRGRGKTQRRILAHRAAYELACGPIPHGLVVCHRCHNPKCVNPEHLLVGTQRDNMEDIRIKNAISKGIKNPRRIDAELFREIKARLAAGETNRAIGASIGASGTLIHDIRSGKHWTCAIYDGGRP